MCLEHEAVCGRAPARIALPLPRVPIGGERGIETGSGGDEVLEALR